MRTISMRKNAKILAYAFANHWRENAERKASNANVKHLQSKK